MIKTSSSLDKVLPIGKLQYLLKLYALALSVDVLIWHHIKPRLRRRFVLRTECLERLAPLLINTQIVK